MTEFDPTPESDDTQRRWQTGTDTFGRVYDVVLGLRLRLRTPKSLSLRTALQMPRKSISTVWRRWASPEPIESRPATYERNEGYLEWQDASRIATELGRRDHRPRGGA